MARARNIKPQFFTNDELAEICPLGRLLFIALWTLSDRDGRLEDRPKKIKAEALPYDDADVDAILDALHQRGFIVRYEANGSRFIQVVAFKKHQNPHVKEAPSTIPAPDKPGASTVQDTTNTGTSPADSLLLIPDSLQHPPTPRKRGEPADPGFARFWAAWPKSARKVARAECAKRWRNGNLEAQADRIVSWVETMARSEQWQRGFEPAPLTAINQRRWEDDGGDTASTRGDSWWLGLGYGSEAVARADGKSAEDARRAA